MQMRNNIGRASGSWDDSATETLVLLPTILILPLGAEGSDLFLIPYLWRGDVMSAQWKPANRWRPRWRPMRAALWAAVERYLDQDAAREKAEAARGLLLGP